MEQVVFTYSNYKKSFIPSSPSLFIPLSWRDTVSQKVVQLVNTQFPSEQKNTVLTPETPSINLK